MVTLATSKIFSRSKKLFKSARAAWISIGEATGLEPRDVRSAGHTRTAWRWIKKGVNPSKSVAKRRKSRRKSRSKRGRSAKQRANDARLGRMARGRSRRRSTPKRRPKRRRKTIRNIHRKRRVAGRGIRSKLQSPLIKKVLMAAGAVSIATTVATVVLPGQASLINNPLVKTAIGFAAGDIPGAVTAFLVGGGLGGLTGGNGGGSGGTGGFA